jgi:hypothetical protein
VTKLVAGQRVTFKTPRGLVYGKILWIYRNKEWARFAPDAGSTYAGGALTPLDADLSQLEPTSVEFQPVTL